MANVKEEFIKWCKQIPQKNGLGYNDDHIHKLLNRLNIINSLHNEEGSIFNVDSDNVNKIIDLLKQLNDDFFKENDPKHRKGKNISVARDLYAHFLILKFDLGEEYWKNFKKLTDIKSNENYFINQNNMQSNVTKINIFHQLIFYGAPGTGKSYKLNIKAKDNFNESNIERVTFHPSLTYGAFIGSFKPYSEDGKITYKYIAGVFIRHLARALKNQNENYLLIIEEINRANTAAVFGDIFQLLDRDESGKSEYEISMSDELKEHLKSVGCLEINKLHLPSNFYIWATMNNADQGVMPLDTAFKRRWDFEYMPLDANSEDKKLSEIEEKWNELRKAINEKLLSLGINEDKLLGFYFLNGKALENEANYLKALQNKVLMYLYEDVLRHCRAKVFGNFTFANISQMSLKDIESIFIDKQNEAE